MEWINEVKENVDKLKAKGMSEKEIVEILGEAADRATAIQKPPKQCKRKAGRKRKRRKRNDGADKNDSH